MHMFIALLMLTVMHMAIAICSYLKPYLIINKYYSIAT